MFAPIRVAAVEADAAHTRGQVEHNRSPLDRGCALTRIAQVELGRAHHAHVRASCLQSADQRASEEAGAA
jgi:hypothetical protein